MHFEPLARLAPKADVTFRVKTQALQAGDLRIKVQLLTDEMRQPITKEASTRVYTDNSGTKLQGRNRRTNWRESRRETARHLFLRVPYVRLHPGSSPIC